LPAAAIPAQCRNLVQAGGAVYGIPVRCGWCEMLVR